MWTLKVQHQAKEGIEKADVAAEALPLLGHVQTSQHLGQHQMCMLPVHKHHDNTKIIIDQKQQALSRVMMILVKFQLKSAAV
jgi:hypothetical protein